MENLVKIKARRRWNMQTLLLLKKLCLIWTAASSTAPFSRSNCLTSPSAPALLPLDLLHCLGRLDGDHAMGVTALVHFLALGPARAHRLTGEEDSNRQGVVVIVIAAGEDLAGADHLLGTPTDHTRAPALDHPFAAVTGCRLEDDRRVMNGVGQVLTPEEQGHASHGRGVIQSVRVGREADRTRVLALVRDRGLTRLTRGGRVPEAGRGQQVEAGEVLAISEIAGQGPLPLESVSFPQNLSCNV